MKKTIKILSALMFSTITSSSIIACANPFVDPSILRVVIVTDGHTITDQSFNQSSYEGALQFKSEFEKWVTNPTSNAPDEYRNKKVVVTPIQPPTIELNTLLQSYGQAAVMDAHVTIASGFVQNNALIAAQNGFLRKKMRYIYIDGDTPKKDVPDKQLAGLIYEAEQAGFLAAIAGGIWLLANKEQFNNKLSMATYGGVEIPAVVNFMYGFYWGIELLNHLDEYASDGNLKTQIVSAIHKLNPDWNENDWPTIKFEDLPDYFTGSFDQASGASKALNASLVSKGASVIFPVAGPQTSDTISAIQSQNSKAKVIGVDTDQALQYKESADYFLTSALKDIVNSVDYMLWKSVRFDVKEENGDHEELPDWEKDFTEDAVPHGFDEDFVGIANNKAISPIYNMIIEKTEALNQALREFLEVVPKGWNQVLAGGNNNLWSRGLGINPFKLPQTSEVDHG